MWIQREVVGIIGIRRSLQARLDAVDEDIAAEARRASLSTHRLLIYERKPNYAASIRVMSPEELARLSGDFASDQSEESWHRMSKALMHNES